MVVQVVPEGVDEVDGVVSGIGIGVTWEQHCKGRQDAETLKSVCLTTINKKWDNVFMG